MIKSFKKVTITLFAVIVVLLLVVGCSIVATASNSQSGSVILDPKNDGITETAELVQGSTPDNTVDTTQNAVWLAGAREQMADGWNKAISASSDTKNINVILKSNWTGVANSESGFGSGDGFYNGSIFIPKGKTITLDLNGFTLDRNLASPLKHGRVITISGTLNLKDNKWDSGAAYEIIQKRLSVNELSCGKIKGGKAATDSSTDVKYGSGIKLLEIDGATPVLNMYGGAICNNYGATSGAGIATYTNGTINYYDGIVAENSGFNAEGDTGSMVGAGILCESTGNVLNMYGGYIYKNKAGTYGGGVRIGSGNTVNLENVLIIGNEAGEYAGGVESSSALNMQGCVITENIVTTGKSSYFAAGVYVSADITIGAGTQVYGNHRTSITGTEDNVYLSSTSRRLNISGSLKDSDTIIGISNTAAQVLTSGYGTANPSVSATKYFYADNSSYHIETVDNEAKLVSGSKSAITWELYENGSKIDSTTKAHITLMGADNATYHVRAKTSSYVAIEDGNGVKYDANVGVPVKSGTYKLYVANPDNYSNGSMLVTIASKTLIEKPDISGFSTIYTGKEIEFLPNGFDSGTMTITENKKVEPGTYKATILLKNAWLNAWEDGTTKSLEITWEITKITLTKPTLSMTKLEYNGSTLTVPIVGFDENTMTISGNTGINAEKKTAVVTLKDSAHNQWADNTTGSVSLDWEILKKPLEKPTEAVQKTFIYDGTEKTYTPNKIVADGMLLTDNKATEVGTYYAKVNLKPNYQWVGNTEEELSFRFMIVPPGLVVKEGVDYDFIYTDNGTWNQRYTYGESYQHKMNDQELNQVGGDNVYILGKVQPNTTIAQFLDNIDSDRDFIKIYNNFGELVFDGTANEVASTIQYIGTSYKVELYVTGESGLEILDEVYISILGDLNADGIVNSADMAMMRRLLNGDINLYSLPLERVLAVYLDNKGGLTSVDQELLNGLVAGRITSNELFEEQELLGEDESYKYIDLVDGRRVQASTESAVIGNVTAGTSISEFVDKVAVFLSVGGASNITLYNNVGELVYKGIEGIQAGHSMQEYVGTGWKVKASNSETQYTVSVLGDVTGDGIINAMDVTYLRRIANDNALLSELEASGNKAVLLAATISNRGGICKADSEILWGTICGTMDLSRYN